METSVIGLSRAALRTLRALILLGCTLSVRASSGDEAAASPSPAHHHVVHWFDFDERASGNVEDVPRDWTPFRPTGFPRFASGKFDWTEGRTAPPSFHLRGEGRNAAYHYHGPATRVRTRGVYRLEAHVKPEAMRGARACVSAHYLDQQGEVLPETVSRSRWVGGEEDLGRWSRVEVELSAAPAEARTIGIILWVLQESVRRPTFRDALDEPRARDVHAGAWFDDLTVHALPQARISSEAKSNVISPEDPSDLLVYYRDDNANAPIGRFLLTDRDGRLLEQRSIACAAEESAAFTRIPVGHLPPGVYRARFEWSSAGEDALSESLGFARVSPRTRSDAAHAGSFGIVLEPGAGFDVEAEFALLNRQLARAIKWPLQDAEKADHDRALASRSEAQSRRLLQELTRAGFALTAMIPLSADSRSGEARRSPHPDGRDPLESPLAWAERFAATAASHVGVFRAWQIGYDGWFAAPTPPKREEEARHLRSALSRYVTAPLLAATRPALLAPDDGANPFPDLLTLIWDAPVAPDDFADQLRRCRESGGRRTSAYVAPLPEDSYDREARLAEWMRRVILARHAGADVVYIPQPWDVRRTPHGDVADPREEFILFRTAADVIGDAMPNGGLRVRSGVECLAFAHQDTAVLAIWDLQAPAPGSDVILQLGDADRQIDPWGRAHPLPRDDRGRAVVRATSMPTFIPHVPRWLVDLAASASLQPARVEAGREAVSHRLELRHSGPSSIEAAIRLDGPSGLEAVPSVFSFPLQPDRPVHADFEVFYPYHQPAGEAIFTARITLGDNEHYLEIPLPVRIGLFDIDVWGSAMVEQGVLRVKHVVANRSNQPVSFRGSAAAQGRERQYRPFANLQPGDALAVEYRFKSGAELMGTKVRLMLTEMNDGPRVHALELTVP